MGLLGFLKGAPPKKLVLHAEDEPDIRAMIEVVLHTLGLEVVGAADGAQALTLARKRTPDLILLDVRMPVLDGIQCCGELRRLPALKTTPILMVSAISQMADVERAMAQGATGYMLKPIDVPKLRQKVAEALNLPKA